MMKEAVDDGAFDYWNLLKSVSRSFYLSMRFLPTAMREPISLGYLLARAADTLADTAEIDKAVRLDALSQFQDWIIASSSVCDFAVYDKSLTRSGERKLLKQIDQVVARLNELDEVNQGFVRGVLITIIAGQKGDLESSGGTSKDSNALMRYTYQVAGCVGEFWTQVGFYNLGEKFADADQKIEMLESGRKLGQALQLTNILRDLYEDLPNGRCYLPADELAAEGWDQKSTPSLAVSQPVVEKWMQVDRDFLEEGKRYVRKLRNSKARFATYLPLLLAEATIDKLERNGIDVFMREKVKISRWKVWLCMLRAALN